MLSRHIIVERLLKALAKRQEEGVLTIGSGNIVHKLGVFSFHDREPFDWAVHCDEEIKRRSLRESTRG
jgi:aromatic ring-opening dioxygenase catalytic subunit (LigB family)